MGYNYNYDGLGSSLNNTMSAGVGAAVWLILSFIIAIVGCFLIYFMFVKKDSKLANKKLEWLRSFLRFDTMLIEPILKIAYIFAAIFITLFPFSFLAAGFSGFLACLLTIILGNLLTRIIYEASLIMVMLWKNTVEIKNKLK